MSLCLVSYVFWSVTGCQICLVNICRADAKDTKFERFVTHVSQLPLQSAAAVYKVIAVSGLKQLNLNFTLGITTC
jgi:hypothetical protein